MTAATLSFRAPVEFAEQTKTLAKAMHMTSSDYVREAVREKNERTLKDGSNELQIRFESRTQAERLEWTINHPICKLPGIINNRPVTFDKVFV